MYSNIPGLGLGMFDYQQNRPSTVTITSLKPDGDPFFPALAEQNVYFNFNLLSNSGRVVRTLVTLKPMRMKAVVASLPPFGVPFEILEDTTFVDLREGSATPIFIVDKGAVGVLDRAPGLVLTLDRVEVAFDEGRFAITFRIAAEREFIDTRGTWFCNPIQGATIIGAKEAYGRSFRRPIVQTIQGTFLPGNANAAVVVHAIVLEDGRVAEAHEVVRLVRYRR
jgi:hypothetical protein